MEHNDCHVHIVPEIVCCFVCFMLVGCAFMEKGKCRCFVSLDLESKLAQLSMLVFAFHEDRWEYGFNQHTRLRKDEELQTYEG